MALIHTHSVNKIQASHDDPLCSRPMYTDSQLDLCIINPLQVKNIVIVCKHRNLPLLLQGGQKTYRMLTQFSRSCSKIYPLISVYIRTFLSEVDEVLPLLAVRGAVRLGRIWVCLCSKPNIDEGRKPRAPYTSRVGASNI